jgi:outer membrane protein OmpA-like peptidoglycan-associated protein
MRLSTIAAATVIAGSAVAWSPSAFAQGSPSADQIIKSLMPSGSLGTGTRGIRPAAQPAPVNTSVQPAAAAPVATSVPMTQQAAAAPVRQAAPAPAPVSAPSVNLTVNFQNGSAELTPDAMRTLDELGAALSSPALSSFRFRIEGHTDTVGSSSYNLSLSQQRAARVAEYLERKFGVTAARLEAVGRGQQAPLVQTGDQVAEPRNRRVQVINLGA